MKKTLQFVESLFTFIRSIENNISNQGENSKAFSSLNINSFVQNMNITNIIKIKLPITQKNVYIITFFSFYKLYCLR